MCKFEEGDIVEIPLPDGRIAIAWILHISKRFKNAVGFVVLAIKGRRLEDVIYDNDTGMVRSLKVLGPLYTHIDNLALTGWTTFAHQPISDEKRQWTRRQVGGGVYVGDDYVGSAAELGERDLRHMLVMGIPVVYKEIEKTFGEATAENESQT